MRATTIRELKHSTSEVLSWVAEGETVEVRRRDTPVALLTPLTDSDPPVRPDFAARLRSIYGNEVLATTGTDVVSESRGDS